MDTNGKDIKRILATFDDGLERRLVEVQNVKDGKAFVQPVVFDPQFDHPVYYHGWETSIANLRGVLVVYENESILLGDPRFPVHFPIIAQTPETVTKES